MIYDDYHYRIPEGKRIRLIIDTDAKNEGDDQYCIVHALLSPRFDIRGIIAAHFGEQKSRTSMLDSYKEICKLLTLMEMPQELAYHGLPCSIGKAEVTESEGTDRIIEEALADNDLSLYVICLGPLTNIAAAYKKEPAIAGRMTVIWIGGGAYPDGEPEYNLSNDIDAANIVFASDLEVWQIPKNAYNQVIVSMAELEDKVYPCGEIGRYLFEQMEAFGHTKWALMTQRTGEYWRMGDSPAVGVLLFPHNDCYSFHPAPYITENMAYEAAKKEHMIRVYHRVDTRAIMEDFYAKIRIFARKKGELHS